MSKIGREGIVIFLICLLIYPTAFFWESHIGIVPCSDYSCEVISNGVNKTDSAFQELQTENAELRKENYNLTMTGARLANMTWTYYNENNELKLNQTRIADESFQKGMSAVGSAIYLCSEKDENGLIVNKDGVANSVNLTCANEMIAKILTERN